MLQTGQGFGVISPYTAVNPCGCIKQRGDPTWLPLCVAVVISEALTPVPRPGSSAIEQRHETEVHMQLHMAMEQGQPWLIGDEVHFHGLVAAQHRDVLDNAAGWLARDAGDLEAVAMQMHGVDIVAGVVHAQPVAPPMVQLEQRFHRLHVEGNAVDRPSIEATHRRILLGERHLDDLVGLRGSGIGPGKTPVVPRKGFRLLPARLAMVPGVLHHDAHTVLAVIVGQISQYPHARPLHFHDGADAFRGTQP